jgi:hypothetical protein
MRPPGGGGGRGGSMIPRRDARKPDDSIAIELGLCDMRGSRKGKAQKPGMLCVSILGT